MVKVFHAKETSRKAGTESQRTARRSIPFHGHQGRVREDSHQGQGGGRDHLGVLAEGGVGRLTMAQQGSVFRKGYSWFLRYRDDFDVDGVMVRKQKCVKLADYCDRYRCERDLDDLVAEKMAGVRQASKCPHSSDLFV